MNILVAGLNTLRTHRFPCAGAAAALAVAAALALAATLPAAAQQAGSSAGGTLPVVRCDPRANSCEAETRPAEVPMLGPAGRATVLSPNLRSTELSLDSAEYRFLIPGCAPLEPGIFVCDSVHQYQHCRTLMFSSFVHSCRAPNPLDGKFAEGRAAAPGEYELEVASNARVKVARGDRSGFGQTRGEARVVLTIAPPADMPGAWCMQRDQFLFYPTGPEGGASNIDETAPCDEPIEFRFKPHEDDVVRAFNVCEEFAAWGSEIEDSIELVAAGLFHMRSANPDFVAEHKSSVAIVAPYVTVSAPLKINCDD